MVQKRIIQKKLRHKRDELGRDLEALRNSMETRVTDPSADIICSGNREPALPGANAGTESGLKVVKQKGNTHSGNERRNHKMTWESTLKRKETRSHKRRTKRRERRRKSRKSVQSRVADTALTYSRAQEALEQDGPDALNKAETSNENTRRTSSAKAEEKM